MTRTIFERPSSAKYSHWMRDEQLVGGGEGIGHEDAEGGGAIEEHPVEGLILAERIEGGAEPGEVVVEAGDFDFGAGEVEIGRDHEEVLVAGGDDAIEDVALADERAVDGVASMQSSAEGARGVGLGVEVDEQHALPQGRQAGGEIDGGRGLADSAFLVGDSNCFHSSWKTCDSIGLPIFVQPVPPIRPPP